MTLTPGTRLGPYEITGPLGAGGMGEVYRARDTRLDRDVAVKVLPPGFENDPERGARFEREAKLLAALNHPNIAVLFGVEHEAGVLCLALELVAGESLAERLKRGPLPMDDAFDVAAQVALALEAAHGAGIVHRDLKPGNVMLRPDGVAKVLDFGLARGPLSAATGAVDLTQSPTMTSPATVPGMILGTAAYMSPEQAKGRPADQRADIWAWGCLLYELLTAERAFPGEDVSETLAAILKSEPDWNALPKGTPPRVRELLQRCLKKDARERLRDAGDLRLLLADARAHLEPVAAVAAARRGGLPWVAAAALVALAVAATLSVPHFRPAAPEGLGRRIVRVPFVPPDSIAANEGTYDYAIISPDGQNVVFTGRVRGGPRLLWLRPLDSAGTRALPGTEDAIEPFWSPDGRSVGFGSAGKLRRVDLAGGRPQTLADAARLVGGAWSGAGVILYQPNYRTGLYRVPAAGGEPVVVVPGDSLPSTQPVFLPDDRHFLARLSNHGAGGVSRVGIGSLDSKELKALLSEAIGLAYAPPGWLLYSLRGSLVARRFDAKALRFSGEPIPISAGLKGEAAFTGRISVSRNGILLLQRPRGYDVQLTWFDRAGRRLGTLGPAARVSGAQEFELSPDGLRVAIKRTDPQGVGSDIWLIDAARGTQDRLTTDPAQDQLPCWSADGRYVYTSSFRNAVGGIYRIAVDGSGEKLLAEGTFFPHAATPDGRLLIYLHRGEKTRLDVCALPLAGGAPFPLLDSEFEEREPRVSPDGRWLAYSSDVTGTPEIYVRAMTPEGKLGEALRLSVGGGIGPRWNRDGRELFYLAAAAGASGGQLMSVAVRPGGPTLQFDAPVRLFETHMTPNTLSLEYEVSPDGQRFLVGNVVGEATPQPVSLVFNWMEELPH